MSKKCFSLLFLLSSSSYIFPMLIIPKRTGARSILKNNVNTFLSTALDKKFEEIHNDFDNLLPLEQHTVLYCCKNLPSCKPLQPIILMAMCLPHETQVEIVGQLLDGDKKSAELFCSLPIKQALHRYAECSHKAQRYSSYWPLPTGFYYRTDATAINLLFKAHQATSKEKLLTSDDMQQLRMLVEQDGWLTEALGIQSKFLYQTLSTQEKKSLLLRSLSQINNIHDFQLALTACKTIFYCTSCPSLLLLIASPWSEIKPAIVPIIITILTISSMPMIMLVPYAADLIKNIYNNEVDNLIEQKKEYLS